MKHTFKKEERLCNKTLIAELYRSGSSFLCYPFRLTWLLAAAPLPSQAQVLIAVPKKRYKHAVDRNLIKRRTREAYRLQKDQHLYQPLQFQQKQIIFSINYIGKEIAEYGFMQKKMLKLLTQLTELAAR
jgi:ribonuclease P protein component